LVVEELPAHYAKHVYSVKMNNMVPLQSEGHFFSEFSLIKP
jgi:hypothetical protein